MSKSLIRFIRTFVASLTVLAVTLLSPPEKVSSQEIEQLNELLDKPRLEQSGSEPHLVSWLTTLELAKEKTRIRRAPILVIAGAEWCQPCRELEVELQNASLQAELQRWVPVHLDVDEDARPARELNVSAIPAIRLLTPDGRITASREGFLDAETLTNWLHDQYATSAELYLADFSETGTPNAIAVIRIVREFSKRDATLREAAVTRLLPHPEVAAAHVLSKLTGGTLAEKLTALEVLKVWNAPINQIDPWIPETLTPESIQKLEQWLLEQTFTTEGQAVGFSPTQIIEADRLIRQMVIVDAAAAASMREQLSRMGDGVLPLLKEALLSEITPQARSRLLASRYRIAMNSERVLSWPGVIERMASADFDERIKAINELTKSATAQDQKLLLALFESPEPLIREMAIQSLQNVSENNDANSALAMLLDDPDANVRAAVLKYLAEKPSAKLIERIRNYIDTENDPDLIVSAIRYLREVESVEVGEVVEALLPLFQHVSWRVRADAVEAVTKLASQSSIRNNVNEEEIQNALIGLLDDEDDFVISKAVLGLGRLPHESALQPLLKTAQRSPDLAPQIIAILTSQISFETEVASHLKPFLTHAEPTVRAAAISGIIQLERSSARTQARQALSDVDPRVQVAAIDAVVHQVISQIVSFKNKQLSKAREGEELFLPSNTDTAILEGIREHKKLEPWVYDFSNALASSVHTDHSELTLPKSRLLAVLGDEEAIEFLNANSNDPDHVTEIAALLPTLNWNDRKFLFEKLITSAESAANQRYVTAQFVSGNEPAVVEVLWSVLKGGDAGQSLASVLHRFFLNEYFLLGPYQMESAPASEKKRLIEDCKSYLAKGSRWQKVCALQLLVAVDTDIAAKHALEVYKNESQPLPVRVDALKTIFWSEPENVSELTFAGIRSEHSEISEVSLSFLALGKIAISNLSDGNRLYSYLNREGRVFSETSIDLTPPEVLQKDDFEKFKESSHPYTLAQAGYILALYGDASCLPALKAVWESQPEDKTYQRLLYRAIARLDSPEHLETLNEIYIRLSKSNSAEVEIQEFYRTIKLMKTLQAVELCEKILQEHQVEDEQ